MPRMEFKKKRLKQAPYRFVSSLTCPIYTIIITPLNRQLCHEDQPTCFSQDPSHAELPDYLPVVAYRAATWQEVDGLFHGGEICREVWAVRPAPGRSYEHNDDDGKASTSGVNVDWDVRLRAAMGLSKVSVQKWKQTITNQYFANMPFSGIAEMRNNE